GEREDRLERDEGGEREHGGGHRARPGGLGGERDRAGGEALGEHAARLGRGQCPGARTPERVGPSSGGGGGGEGAPGGPEGREVGRAVHQVGHALGERGPGPADLRAPAAGGRVGGGRQQDPGDGEPGEERERGARQQHQLDHERRDGGGERGGRREQAADEQVLHGLGVLDHAGEQVGAAPLRRAGRGEGVVEPLPGGGEGAERHVVPGEAFGVPEDALARGEGAHGGDRDAERGEGRLLGGPGDQPGGGGDEPEPGELGGRAGGGRAQQAEDHGRRDGHGAPPVSAGRGRRGGGATAAGSRPRAR